MTADLGIIACRLCGGPWDEWHQKHAGKISWRQILTGRCRPRQTSPRNSPGPSTITAPHRSHW